MEAATITRTKPMLPANTQVRTSVTVGSPDRMKGVVPLVTQRHHPFLPSKVNPENSPAFGYAVRASGTALSAHGSGVAGRVTIHVAIILANARTAAVSCSGVSGSDSTPTTRTSPDSGLTRGSGTRES